MSNENKMNSMLVGAFLITMIGVLVFSCQKKRSGNTPVTSDGKSLVDSFSDKFLTKLADAEEKLKNTTKEKHFNLPHGEFGLFL
jgi:hypothetical protein